MKRKTKILQTMSAITLSFCFYACTDDTVENSPNYQQSVIDNMITDFYHSTSPQTRNSGNGSLRISKIDTMTYILTNDTVLSKKELNTEAYIDSFKIETVTFNIGQQTGYAIVSDDSRLERVYYFTDNGLLNDTSEIWPLKQYIDSIPLNAYRDIINKKVANKTRATTLEILPIVQTSWGQGWPYNLYIKPCTCSSCSSSYYRQHRPTGCVTTAVAQVIAHCGVFHGTYYGNGNIDFSSLHNNLYEFDAYFNDGKAQQVAQFFHEIGLNCQIQFTCEGGHGTAKAAYHYLLDLGYNCSYVEGGINTTRVIQELQAGYPHLICGHLSGGNGHMWIVDGIRIVDGITHYHLNWGHDGSHNGWSYGDPYSINDGTEKEYSSNMEQIYINSIQ